MNKKIILFSLIALFAWLPLSPLFFSVYAAKGPQTVDPYQYLDVASVEEVMELIRSRKDKAGNPLYVSQLSFNVEPSADVIMFNARSREEYYKLEDKGFGFSGQLDVNLDNGFTIGFPFSTGEYVYEDTKNRFYSVDYEGEILVKCRASVVNDEKALYELSADFIGTTTEKERNEREHPGEVLINEEKWTEENPKRVSLAYMAEHLPPSYAEDNDSRKNMILRLHVNFSDVEWIVRLNLVSMEISEAPLKVIGSVDTDAEKNPGETAVSIPEIIAIAILGGGAAILGAGSGGDKGNRKGNKKSRYQIRFKKDFGDSIRAGALPVPVYARMVEITPEGNEVDRPDLSSMITIDSSDFDISGIGVTGGYMEARISIPKKTGDTGVLSVCFSGGEGSFTNNITFRITGDPYIEYTGHKGTNQMYVLGGSGRTFTMDCKAVDFPKPPTLSVRGEYPEFTVEIESLEDNNYRISVTDTSEKPQNLEGLKKGLPVEIAAEYDNETYSSSFTVIQCFEGLAADFWGKPKEIRGYKDESDEMAKTLIGFSLGVWNEKEGMLDEHAPQDIEVNFEDEKGICNIIGITWKRDEESSLEHITNFVFQAKTPYPSLTDVKGKIRAVSGEYAYESDMTLIPDIQQYTDNYEKEYAGCRYAIETYMPPEYRERWLERLALNRYLLGVEDLKIFRMECWNFAQDCIIKQRDSYLNEALWQDRFVTALEILSFIGDIAFDLALAPIGGPITGFLAGQVKSLVIELVVIIQEQPDKSIADIGWELIQNRLIQTAGSGDGAFDMPDLKKPKELTVWLTCYSAYRFAYHWQFDKDDQGNSIGICESIKSTVLDLTGKGAGLLLGDYVSKAAKGRWPEKISIKEADEKLTKDIIGGTANTLRDGTEKLTDTVNAVMQDTMVYVTDTLVSFLDKLKAGI